MRVVPGSHRIKEVEDCHGELGARVDEWSDVPAQVPSFLGQMRPRETITGFESSKE